ncbi:MAG: bacillithiol biosynthesis cysteine-adding enzyme BshC [Ignavibacterium album]|uniref:bacillithiol biosynthesis cysteine-adding enzyme BshC n=1 Tax=Ignavibacterium album TaxID=591197 RepID=UPI0026EB1C10|nr:bacillithiol biosynthesis cysteine-adding enzyme BshC [Ignavibacterium album]MCX8104502.1 bacillithiol biosynthesis cysteine-adding enzyme BshC [Ignavibacterium album]
MFINFGDIPKNQNLFLDYIYEFENVAEFYRYNFRDKEKYPEIFKSILKKKASSNFKISEIISNQYKRYNSLSDKTKKNIKLLESPKTLAVITGQQLGILSGPLYTIYKIITAIKLSSQLNERYTDFNFVPVFWMESDDHDFNEVHQINILNNENNIVNIKYKEDVSDDAIRASVGNLIFDESINEFFNQLELNLRQTEFKSSIISKLREIYSTGKSFKESFRELLYWLFDEYGLIIFDPSTEEVKQTLKPIFLTEINNFRVHTQKLVSVSATLEEMYHAQVKVKPVNLFYHIENGRYSIEPVDEIFKLRRKRKQFTKDEIILEINEHPERFSPNVLLRPITQDYLFPTAFYVAGPSEISYFAQIHPLYEFFEIEPPVIYPRSSATLVEKSVLTFMEKYDLTMRDVFLGIDHLKEKILSTVAENNIDLIFEDATKNMNLIFDEIKEKLFAIDKTISDSTNRYREKVLFALNELKSKAEKAHESRFETIIRQISKLSNLLYPNENLQERELNYFYFANKFGQEFHKKLYDELSVSDFEHQIIEI